MREPGQGRRLLRKNIVVFYTLLDAGFFAYTTSFTTRSKALCSYQCYGAYGAIYLSIGVEKFCRRVLTRSAAPFLPKALFMLFSYIFSYLENFFMVFYCPFIFHSGQAQARATHDKGEQRHFPTLFLILVEVLSH